MKVLLIHQAFVTGSEAGGTRHYEFGQRLAAHSDRLVVVASQVSYLTGAPIDASRGVYYRQQFADVDVLRAYSPPVLHRGFAWRIVAFAIFALTSVYAGLRAARPDLVMGTSPPMFQACSAWLVARLRRRPFLLEVRDLWPEFAIAMGVLHNPLLQAIARGMERFLYRHADHLLVNSPAYREYLLRHGVPEAKISVIPNGVDVGMFAAADVAADIRATYGLGGKVVAVYAGALGMANDIPTILAAAERLRGRADIHFLLVGDGKERANLELEARRRTLLNVTFTGALPKAQMPAILAAADLCIATLLPIPAFTTTYPNKVFDYMAAGKPTILAIDGVIRRVIEAAQGGMFVVPGDATSMAAAIVQLAGDSTRRSAMGEAARQYVTEHFNRDQQAEAFRRVIANVVAGHPGTAGEKAKAR